MQAPDKILMNKQGHEAIPSAPPKDWSVYLASHATASEQFMDGVENLPVEERHPPEAGK
jgi:hypothetical protein